MRHIAPPTQTTPGASKSLSLSTQGLDFIKAWEKFSSKLYDTDGANACTIGYGHLVHKGKCHRTNG